MGNERDDSTLVVDARAVQGSLEKPRATTCVIVIAGPRLGQVFRIGGGAIVGRGETVDVPIPDSEISRQHARFVVEEDAVYVEDMGSTNGTFVNGQQVERKRLREGDKIQVGTTVMLRFSHQDQHDEQFQRRMYESISRDGLTGAYNRTHFMERLESEFAFSQRHRTPLTLLMIDVDHFKSINDTHGHLSGDRVLQKVVEVIHAGIRTEDLFARFGGEEFILLTRGIDHRAAVHLGERLLRTIRETAVALEETSIHVTVSIGVATGPDTDIDTPTCLIEAADTALYEAKAAGRDRLVARAPDRTSLSG